MSRVEEIVAEQLANQPTEVIPNGHRYRLASGITELTFRPVVSGTNPSDVTHIATVETQFVEDMPDFSQADVARLNRRSAFGSFYRAEDGFRSKATYSIYKDEPNPQWVAAILAMALVQQQPLGIGIVQAELSSELARANRASLNYPRNWANAAGPEAFEAVAADLRTAGYILSLRPDGLVLAVQFDEGEPCAISDGGSETALMRVTTDVRHPLAGVGYLGTIALPSSPPRRHIVEWSAYLNAQEHEQDDFPPRLGAWGMRGSCDQLAYALFLPTDRHDPRLAFNIATWLIWRALWIKQTFWKPGSGLHRSRSGFDG
jgi:hypothetical protein